MIRNVFAPAAALGFALAVMFPSVSQANPRDEVLAAYQAMAKAGKFRVVGMNETPQGAQKDNIEIVWPDRFHVMSGHGEIIVIPGATYVKQGAKWQMFPMDMSKMIERYRPEAMRDQFERTVEVKALGDSDINGHAARGYEYDTSVTVQGITAKSHAKLWVAKDSGLPIHQESDGEAMGHKSHHVADYEFDPSIKIDAPM